MKIRFATLATVSMAGLVFGSGCDRPTEPGTDMASTQPTLRATSITGGMPDLTIDADRLASSMFIVNKQNFKATSCAVQEECCGVGRRRLLKFEAFISNIGDADLALGPPRDDEDLFELSTCHGHYHVTGFATYELLDSDGATVRAGHKQAFCLMDFTRTTGTGPGVYTCSNQGIQAGWADVYGSYLDCQWIDITDVPPGQYLLRVTINANPDLSPKLTESDYTNNTAEVSVTIPAAGKVKS